MVAHPTPQLALPLTGPELRDQALDLLEEHRADYIAAARSHADAALCAQGEVSADDLHERCPVPPGMDGRVLGAVFKGRYRLLRYQPSRRPECHGRIIPIWGKK